MFGKRRLLAFGVPFDYVLSTIFKIRLTFDSKRSNVYSEIMKIMYDASIWHQ